MYVKAIKWNFKTFKDMIFSSMLYFLKKLIMIQSSEDAEIYTIQFLQVSWIKF